MGPFGSDIKKEVYTDSGVPVLNGSNLQGFELVEDSFGYVTEEKADSLKKANAHRGDIVITHRGTIGQIVYIPQNSKFERYVISQSQFRVTCNKDIVLPEYLTYYFHTREGQYKLLSNASQVGVPALARASTTFRKLEIDLPSIEIQRKAIDIILELQQKIAVNRRICANLEAQAQALFKHWFIDFAPFKDGKFVESELGMIPEGWRVGSILDIAELYDYQRKPLSSMERKDMKGDYPYYGATSIMDYIDKYIFDGTYVLMGEDGSVVKDNGCPYLQYVWGKFWPNNHAHVMQGKNGFSTEMLYCFLSITDVRSIVTGAVQMKISQRSMSHLLTVIPSKSVCGDYNRIIRPLFDLIKSTKEENARLSTLRDTLLPKLMSGEIKV